MIGIIKSKKDAEKYIDYMLEKSGSGFEAEYYTRFDQYTYQGGGKILKGRYVFWEEKDEDGEINYSVSLQDPTERSASPRILSREELVEKIYEHREYTNYYIKHVMPQF
ncbi:hypothetical protein [Aneurinibacillus tyrosinisolvens]|uniref:hypothetical protein n=1 Tax=Aneurinibacillus tyrosinisolvens TaxID=1443435 RepID=UPI00063FCDA6|nr:hypothetical protein [Aneurinibacillus tyrosinisolvens]